MSESTKELSGRELDKAVAEKVMSHVTHVDDNEGWCANCREEMMEYRQARYRQQGGVKPTETRCIPEYSESIAVAMLVEDRIAELGLSQKYALILAQSLPSWEGNTNMALVYWQLAHATAEQRCRAALSAMEQKS